MTKATLDIVRCSWPGEDPLYRSYHDEEWGVPEYDDRALYETAVLDGFQAGLSWITILRKRENFRRAFDGFFEKPERIARYGKRRSTRLLKDAGIIRSPRNSSDAATRAASSARSRATRFGTSCLRSFEFTNRGSCSTPIPGFITSPTGISSGQRARRKNSPTVQEDWLAPIHEDGPSRRLPSPRRTTTRRTGLTVRAKVDTTERIPSGRYHQTFNRKVAAIEAARDRQSPVCRAGEAALGTGRQAKSACCAKSILRARRP